MERISAIICELNPIHDGHRHIMSKAKSESDILIAVMSGSFVQRGECAVYDKYRRAGDTLAAGADIVFELPFPFCASSAEYFAAAGVAVAKAAGATDLYFGSECADESALFRAAKVLSERGTVSAGRAAEQREMRLRESGVIFPNSIYCSPNDILAVEYCKNEGITMHPIHRIPTKSAGDIRMEIFSRRDDDAAVYPESLTSLEFAHYRTVPSSGSYAESGGGVGERLHNCAFDTNDCEMWLRIAATKQYTNARLRRAALFEVCAVSSDMLRQTPLYTTVLAANHKGRSYLKKNRPCFSISVITNPSERRHLSEKALAQYEKGVFADKLYSLCARMSDPAALVKMSPVIE